MKIMKMSAIIELDSGILIEMVAQRQALGHMDIISGPGRLNGRCPEV